MLIGIALILAIYLLWHSAKTAGQISYTRIETEYSATMPLLEATSSPAYKEPVAPIKRRTGQIGGKYSPPQGTLAERIIACESGNNPLAKNHLSSASGLGQFLTSTWKNYSIKHWGEVRDVFNAEDNRELVNWVVENYGTNDWIPSKFCWS